MITLDCNQGSDEWFAARLGIPTASKFSDIVTSTGKSSASKAKYMNKLLAEFITGDGEHIEATAFMERGTELESEARAYYEFETDSEITEVGLIYKDESKLISCSPDGLRTKQKKGLEIKCPSAGVHIANLLANKIPTNYICQVQGSMWVTGYEEWDFMSYHPDMPSMIVTVEKDEQLHSAFDKYLNIFIEQMLEKREQLLSIKGIVQQAA